MLNMYSRIPVGEATRIRITDSALYVTWIRSYSRLIYSQYRLNRNRIPDMIRRFAHSTRRGIAARPIPPPFIIAVSKTSIAWEYTYTRGEHYRGGDNTGGGGVVGGS